ncbi:MAG TPA: hypothetical protein EYM96_12070 [Rhodospirillales bacterium]|nr:hypothetical protein [Rhodospirillales bacterium]
MAKSLEELADIKAATTELLKLEQERLVNAAELTDAQRELQVMIDDERIARDKIRGANKASALDAQEVIDRLKEQIDAEGDVYKRVQLRIALKETEVDLDQILLDNAEQKVKWGEELNDQEKERFETSQDISDELAKQKESMGAMKTLGASLGAKMAVYGRHSMLTTQHLTKLWDVLKSSPRGWVAFVDGLGKGAIMAVLDTIINLALQVDMMESKFRQATGASEAFTRNLTAVYEETRKIGVTAEEAGIANQVLYNTFTNFTLILPRAAKQVSRTTQLLTQFGVGAGQVAEGMQTANKAFGQTAEQAAKSALEINALAEDLGVIPKEMAANYATVGKQLAKLGDQGTKAFKDLALVSKITGMEMQKVLHITDKFDTFEGAAEQTGKLNAALGGNFVNAMDLMMETDPAGRFNMIRDSILDAGLSFDSMTYYQRKYFTTAAGLDDVSDLAMMLSGNYDDLTGDIGKTSAQYADQAKKAKEMKDIMQQLKLSLQEMIPVALKIVDWLRDFAENIDENIKSIKKWAIGLGVAYGVIKGFFIVKSLIVLWKAWKLQTALLGAAQAVQTGIQEASNIVIIQSGPAAASASAGLGMFALAALGVGVAIGIAAVGMAELVKAFGTLNGAGEIVAAAFGLVAFGGAIAIVAVGLAALSTPLSWAGVAVLGAIGVAALMVGGAIKMAGDSITGLIDSMSTLAGTNSPFTGLVKGLEDVAGAVNDVKINKAKALTQLIKEAKKAEVNISATEALQIATLNRETVRHMVTVNPDLDMSFRSDNATGGRRELPSQTFLLQMDGPATTAVLQGEIGKAAAKAVGN